MRSRATGVGALLVLALVLADAAAASSCAMTLPRDVVGSKVVTVVEGTVEASSLFGTRVRVQRVYVGDAHRTITVFPDWSFRADENLPWTFYLRPVLIGYLAVICGGGHPGTATPEELDLFGEGRAPTPDDPFLGPVGSSVLVFTVGLGLAAALRARTR